MRISFCGSVFSAIKPKEVELLVRSNFNAGSSAKLRFQSSYRDGGVWSDAVMPWATVTLVNFDFGFLDFKFCFCQNLLSLNLKG